MSLISRRGGGGGYSDSRLGSIFWGSKFLIQYYLEFSEKMNIFRGIKILRIFFRVLEIPDICGVNGRCCGRPDVFAEPPVSHSTDCQPCYICGKNESTPHPLGVDQDTLQSQTAK